jgi:hypothetical protein
VLQQVAASQYEALRETLHAACLYANERLCEWVRVGVKRHSSRPDCFLSFHIHSCGQLQRYEKNDQLRSSALTGMASDHPCVCRSGKWETLTYKDYLTYKHISLLLCISPAPYTIRPAYR